MGIRLAPLAFLLVASCVTADGFGPVARDGEGTPRERPALVRSASPPYLPAAPRMRPESIGRARPTGPVQAANPGSAGDPAPAHSESDPEGMQSESGARIGRGRPAASTDTTDEGPEQAENDGSGGNASSTIPDGSLDTSTLTTTPVAGFPSGVDPAATPSDAGDIPDLQAAAAAPPEPRRGIDVESLFDGDVVRYCEAMWRMGEYIGAARRRGEPSGQAIDAAVRRIATERDLPFDNRLVFSGEVYGRLLYRMEDRHAARTLGAYVHFACLTVRGDKKIVPADPVAERQLNTGLARCEGLAFTRDDLNACIFRELTPVVDHRNG